MKRRDFIAAAAGIGAGSMLAGVASPAKAEHGLGREPKRFQIYKCAECGTILEILEAGKVELKPVFGEFPDGSPALLIDKMFLPGRMDHCGKLMKLLEAKTEDEGREKHVPVIKKIRAGYEVVVGSVAHPMEESHYISMIQLIVEAEGCTYTKLLKPGDKPEAVFLMDANWDSEQDVVREIGKRGAGEEADTVVARAYCNKHGLWQSK